MAAKRLMSLVALAVLVTTVGCQSWCDHRYPCHCATAPAATAACVPCCPAPAAGYTPAVPAAAAAPNWGAPQTQPACVCTR